MAVVGVGREEEHADMLAFVLMVSLAGSAEERGGVAGGGVDAAEDEEE